jgi:large subunit ribosomal protein L19
MDTLLLVEKELQESLKRDYPEFNPGDVVKVYYKIREKDKVRLHPIEGVVIKKQGHLHRKSFTVRRSAYGETYEVSFPYYSPNIDTIELVKQGARRPRRARLYYLRARIGKKAAMA